MAGTVIGGDLQIVLTLAANLAVVLSLLAAIYQSRLAAEQLKMTREELARNSQEQRRTRVFDFARRWNELEFVKARRPMYDFFQTTKGDYSQLKPKLEGDAQFRSVVSLVVNFMEELGLAYNRESVDKKLAYAAFGYVVEDIYENTRTYIEHLRPTHHDETILREFTDMRENMLKLRGETLRDQV